MKRRLSNPLVFTILIVYSVIASILFFQYGLPSLEGKISQQMYSDSVTYEEAADALGPDDKLITIGGNYLGPLLVLRFFDFNRIVIHYFNLSIIFCSILIAFRYLNVNRGILLLAVLSSPLLLFSTFGVNKEVFLLPLSVCLAVFLQRRKAIWLVLAIVTALFVRWQMVLFVLLVFLVTSKLNIFHAKRWTILAVLTVAIAIAYPTLVSGPLEEIEQISVEGAQDEIGTEASGVYPTMQEIQRSYGYVLVVIPKTTQLLVGLLSRFSVSAIELDFWNNFVLMSQSLHNLFLIGLAFSYRRFTFSEDYFFLICIFAIMFAVTPVFAPRYFYPIAIWLALWLSSKNSRSRRRPRRSIVHSGKIILPD